jgi:hypothetical protein
MSSQLRNIIACSIVSAAFAAPAFSSDVSFTEITAEVRGGGPGAMSVSENGEVTFRDLNYFYQWSQAEGLQVLGGTLGAYTQTVANISSDGQTIAYHGVLGWGTTVVFKDGGMEEISRADIIGSSLSPNGQFVGGFLYGSGSNGANGPVAALNLTDGSVVANNNADFANYEITDFNSFGDIQLATPKGFMGANASFLISDNGSVQEIDSRVQLIRDLSGDGSTVVGQTFDCENYSFNCTVMWKDGNFSELGLFFAHALNFDGSVAVGAATTGQSGGIIWDAVNGIRDISDVLAAKGIDMSGWSNVSLFDMSDDGTYIVGAGVNPEGARHGFMISVLPQCSVGL